jgi:hypothetical protein
MNFLAIATTVCIGLLIGTEFSVAAFVNPILEKLDIVARTEATRLFGRRLGAAMPVWYIASIVLLAAEMIVNRHEAGFTLLCSATVLWAVAILMSIFLLVPINNRLTRAESQAFTETERGEHRRWDMLHRVRVGVLTLAMICFLLAVQG